MSVKEPSERPAQELSPQNQAEVQKLRKLDDESLPVDKRLTVLVERLIVDAIQRQDEGLTKVSSAPSAPLPPPPLSSNDSPVLRVPLVTCAPCPP